ncbi:VWA domain-containing protein [Corynebacterium xerosis]|uniref:vWA domain-containing protein n=1 Tax=Corynebacterium xerosis TaxID=1725 RepID=UPI000EB3E156|nr:VWA domain-containing protein [Corynebacterium xerosis]AYJ33061.1 VWA domain-containing protein [Corynebacterium xerosis]
MVANNQGRGTLMLPLNEANPDARQLAVVVLDTSGSMTPYKDELVKAWGDYVKYTNEDELASRRVETGVVTVSNTAMVAIPVDEVRNLSGLKFDTGGMTALGAGLELALEIIELRKKQYRDKELWYLRPWIIVMSDGKPTDTDKFDKVVGTIRALERNKGVTVYPIAIGKTVDMETLGRLSADRKPIRLEKSKFRKFFQWLSNSISATALGGDRPQGAAIADQETMTFSSQWTAP